MASKIRRVLLAAVACGALLNAATQAGFARGGGGGHFGGGTPHVGGGGHFGAVRSVGGVHFGTMGVGRAHAHFGGAHFGSTQVRGFGRGHAGVSHVSRSHFGRTAARNGANIRNLNGARTAPHTSFARSASGAQAVATRATGAFAGKTAWNQWGNPNWQQGWSGWNGTWGGWYAGWGGWAGPVFWPYFFGNLLGFVFWPSPYFDPFWAYEDWFVWDALFWPGPYYYGPDYASSRDYYDVYGDYAYNSHARTSYHAAREARGAIPNQTDLAQSCGGIAPGVTDLPIHSIEATLRLSGDQLKALDQLKAASSRATDLLKTSCSNEVPLTPVERLDAVEKRIDGMMQALANVRTPLDNFYNSLDEEQQRAFAALKPAGSERRQASTSNNDFAALCSPRTEGFTQLPAQHVEQIVKPTQQQLDVFDKLKSASIDAANQLHASCPTQLPQTPLDRFDAVSKRVNAMSEAIKTVRPALADFYASLSDEQKARFNMLGPPNTSRHG